MAAYLPLLLLTIVVETGLVCLLAPRDRARLIVDAPLLNLMTHPVAYMAIVVWGAPFLWIEALVIAVEALGYRIVSHQPAPKALGLALIANLVTIGLAVLLSN